MVHSNRLKNVLRIKKLNLAQGLLQQQNARKATANLIFKSRLHTKLYIL